VVGGEAASVGARIGNGHPHADRGCAPPTLGGDLPRQPLFDVDSAHEILDVNDLSLQLDDQ
jgi:hypothetical protein